MNLGRSYLITAVPDWIEYPYAAPALCTDFFCLESLTQALLRRTTYVQSSTYLLDLTYMRVVLHCIQIQTQIRWPEIFLILETKRNQNKTKRRTE